MNPALLTPALLKYTAGSVSVTCDGNSLTSGQGASYSTYSYPSVLATAAPLAAGAIPVVNIGVGGQTAANMTSSQADVGAAWAAGKTNILIAWELTNSLQTGASASSAVSDMLAYVTSVKGSHAWKVVLLTALPRYQNRAGDGAFTQTEVDAYNAAIDAANSLLRTSWRGVADALIDLRAPGSPFAFADYAASTFSGSGLFGAESYAGGTAYVHCNDAGYAQVTGLVAAGLRRIRAR